MGNLRKLLLFCCLCWIRCLIFCFVSDKKLVDDEPYNTDSDGGISHVEDGVEEDQSLSAKPWHPRWPLAVNQREIKHVHHLAVQERGIASFRGEEGGYFIETLIEDEPVEAAVDQVSHSADKDEADADQKRGAHVVSDKVYQVVADGCRRQQSKEREHDFAYMSAKGHAKSHAFVFHEVEQTPVADERNLLTDAQGGLYPYFYHLINNQDGGDQAKT